MRPNKYGARKTEYRGVLYDSAAEAYRASQLDLMKLAGRIIRWERGVNQCVFDGGTPRRRIHYKPDFLVTEEYTVHAEDVKGAMPRDFRLRAILWEAKFPNIPLRVIDKYGNVKWSLDERTTMRRMKNAAGGTVQRSKAAARTNAGGEAEATGR